MRPEPVWSFCQAESRTCRPHPFLLWPPEMGRTEEIRKRPGEFMAFTEPWEHQPENLSGKDFEAIYLEIGK